MTGSGSKFDCGSVSALKRFLVAAVLGFSVSACGTTPVQKSTVDKKYGVTASKRIVAEGKKVPKGGGYYKVGKPYKIAGKWYHPKEDKNYTAVGMASWYGEAFHGRMTANGELYDMNTLTAAHPTLPLPSYVRVTNLSNKRSVVVRVNDRGPYAHTRVIDMSKKAAEMLDFQNKGITKVKVEYVGRARMDGLDHQMLVASYRGPGASGTISPDIMLAQTQPRATPVREQIPLLALATPRQQAPGAGFSLFSDTFKSAFKKNTLPRTNIDLTGAGLSASNAVMSGGYVRSGPLGLRMQNVVPAPVSLLPSALSLYAGSLRASKGHAAIRTHIFALSKNKSDSKLNTTNLDDIYILGKIPAKADRMDILSAVASLGALAYDRHHDIVMLTALKPGVSSRDVDELANLLKFGS